MKVTKCYVVEEEQAEKIERVAVAAGLSESAVIRSIIDRWDGSILISVAASNETKDENDSS